MIKFTVIIFQYYIFYINLKGGFMRNFNDISLLYKNQPVEVEQNTESNPFTDMILQTKKTATEAFDKLAYLAGIKNAPADDKYSKLNTSNLNAFFESAKLLGYDIEIINV